MVPKPLTVSAPKIKLFHLPGEGSPEHKEVKNPS